MYLLDKDELDNLVPKVKLAEKEEALATAKKVILLLHGSECKHHCYSCPLGGGNMSETANFRGEDDDGILVGITSEQLDQICTYDYKYQDFPK